MLFSWAVSVLQRWNGLDFHFRKRFDNLVEDRSTGIDWSTRRCRQWPKFLEFNLTLASDPWSLRTSARIIPIQLSTRDGVSIFTKENRRSFNVARFNRAYAKAPTCQRDKPIDSIQIDGSNILSSVVFHFPTIYPWGLNIFLEKSTERPLIV